MKTLNKIATAAATVIIRVIDWANDADDRRNHNLIMSERLQRMADRANCFDYNAPEMTEAQMNQAAYEAVRVEVAQVSERMQLKLAQPQ